MLTEEEARRIRVKNERKAKLIDERNARAQLASKAQKKADKRLKKGGRGKRKSVRTVRG